MILVKCIGNYFLNKPHHETMSLKNYFSKYNITSNEMINVWKEASTKLKDKHGGASSRAHTGFSREK